jgi:hypothetical protein
MFWNFWSRAFVETHLRVLIDEVLDADVRAAQ